MLARAVTATTTETTTTAGAGSTIQGRLGFQLNYTVTAPNDMLVLMNQRAIYMAALCNSVKASDSPYYECSKFDLHLAYTPPRMFGPKDNNKLIFDPYFLLPPICVLCVKPPGRFPVNIDTRDKLDIIPILAKKWLYWFDLKTPSASNSPPEGSVYIGDAGGRRFYASSYADFADFVLMTLPLPASLPRSAPTTQPPTAER
jgi:hypothetical protein